MPGKREVDFESGKSEKLKKITSAGSARCGGTGWAPIIPY